MKTHLLRVKEESMEVTEKVTKIVVELLKFQFGNFEWSYERVAPDDMGDYERALDVWMTSPDNRAPANHVVERALFFGLGAARTAATLIQFGGWEYKSGDYVLKVFNDQDETGSNPRLPVRLALKSPYYSVYESPCVSGLRGDERDGDKPATTQSLATIGYKQASIGGQTSFQPVQVWQATLQKMVLSTVQLEENGDETD